MGRYPKPTKNEAERIEAMMRLGCRACASLNLFCPADECHHIVEGNKRLGHNFTIPLCRGHHRGIWNPELQEILSPQELVAISSGRHAWRRIYPNEFELWCSVQDRLHLPKLWPVSKILLRNVA
jgi:hypothetical protein